MSKSVSGIAKDLCAGCRSCAQVCPKNSIKMVEDEEGFFYPEVDSNCVDCGLCVKHCPALTPVELSDDNDCYSLILKDKEKLAKSSSGGLCSIAAEKIIEKGGVVFGCAFDENLIAKHIKVDNINDLEKIRRSKYVASSTGDTFTEVKTELKTNRTVLYIGTPCQIAGLKAFLGKNYENLYTIDLICHGVPSQKFFSKYISWLEKKYKRQVTDYRFRDKDVGGWFCGSKAKVIMVNKKVIINCPTDPYFGSFLKASCYRESCYKCRYAQKLRVGDMTAGDFWGVEKFYENIDISGGVSAAMVNSKKGNQLLELINNEIELVESSFDNMAYDNENLKKPVNRRPIRDYIYNGIDEEENIYFSKFMETKFSFKVKWHLKHFIAKITPRKIKDLRKKMMSKV